MSQNTTTTSSTPPQEINMSPKKELFQEGNESSSNFLRDIRWFSGGVIPQIPPQGCSTSEKNAPRMVQNIPYSF